MGESNWFRVGVTPDPIPATSKQRWFLKNAAEQVLDILTPEERVAVELMGFEEWMESKDKYEASRLIGRIKGNNVAADVTRRSSEDPKWWHTGRGGS